MECWRAGEYGNGVSVIPVLQYFSTPANGPLPLKPIRKVVVPGAVVLALIIAVLVFRFHPDGRALLRDFTRPFTVADSAAEDELAEQLLMLRSKAELVQEITGLQQAEERSAVHLARIEQLERENCELRRLLRLDETASLVATHARVVFRDPAAGGRRLQLNRGEQDGIAVGQPVLANGFLLGRIAEVSKQTAGVLTIADANCRLSVCPADTRCYGILAGTEDRSVRGRPVLLVRHLQLDCEISEGQVIETSDYSIAPPGIKVGTVVDAAPGPLGNEYLDRTIKIRPFVFDRAFTYVTVLTGSREPGD